jgi:aspartate 1-decarboxylase
MKRLILGSMKLKATVTEADVAYVGCITIDEDLIDKAIFTRMRTCSSSTAPEGIGFRHTSSGANGGAG